MQSPQMAVSKSSPIPLYYQLAERLRERIRSGELAAGDQLPADRELAEQAGISRMTARQAIAYLVREGTLVVKPGIGTFVAEPKLAYDALHLLGFTEETMRHGGAVASRVLEQVMVTPPAVVAAALELGEDETTVKIVRLRSAGKTPVLLETSYVPAAGCPGLEDEDLETQSLYLLLDLRFGIRLQRAHQTIEATVANQYESGLFEIAAGTPMLLLEGVTYADGDRPAEYFKAVYRADRIKFELESRRDSGQPHGAAAPQMSVVLT
ncbi:MAG: GntR family transcriptional regulator [Thermomicrobiales bacterium]|nr:GntR family transcriptional regulator [Thermomicrobiales bacterium]